MEWRYMSIKGEEHRIRQGMSSETHVNIIPVEGKEEEVGLIIESLKL